jgi:hypothetical protein
MKKLLLLIAIFIQVNQTLIMTDIVNVQEFKDKVMFDALNARNVFEAGVCRGLDEYL